MELQFAQAAQAVGQPRQLDQLSALSFLDSPIGPLSDAVSWSVTNQDPSKFNPKKRRISVQQNTETQWNQQAHQVLDLSNIAGDMLAHKRPRQPTATMPQNSTQQPPNVQSQLFGTFRSPPMLQGNFVGMPSVGHTGQSMLGGGIQSLGLTSGVGTSQGQQQQQEVPDITSPYTISASSCFWDLEPTPIPSND